MKRTILIANHDPSVRNVLRQLLEPEGYDVVQAESGEQALALATALPIDVFFLGAEMPRMNGIVLCRELRAIEQYHDTPIIFLIENAGDAILNQALTVGGDDFIQTPYTSVTVRARLKIQFR